MKITIVTRWYNEEIFAPFFLSHYSYADEIYIFLDKDTDDGTREICKQYANVEIRETSYEGCTKPDELHILSDLNLFVAALKSDWVFLVDIDELIFPANGESAKAVLARQSANLLYAQMWQSWRHETETDLDQSKPSVYQRRHGVLGFKRKFKELFTKPSIIKPEVGIRWHAGHHSYRGNKKIIVSEERFLGSHWKKADLDRWLIKRMERYDRWPGQARRSRQSIKQHIIKEFKRHLNDPQMF